MTNYFADIESEIHQSGLTKPVGCTPGEVSTLEMDIGYKLPEAYKAFLSLMGKDYDGVLRGTDCFIKHVIENTKYLPSLLKENGADLQLSERYLAFFCHQGYIMAWFDLPKLNEDPPCYLFSEGETPMLREFPSITEFLKKDIVSMLKFIKEDLRAKSNPSGASRRWWEFWK